MKAKLFLSLSLIALSLHAADGERPGTPVGSDTLEDSVGVAEVHSPTVSSPFGSGASGDESTGSSDSTGRTLSVEDRLDALENQPPRSWIEMLTGELKGPQGAPGPRGPQGDQGPQGLQGEKGERGESGAAASVDEVVNKLLTDDDVLRRLAALLAPVLAEDGSDAQRMLARSYNNWKQTHPKRFGIAGPRK